MRPKSGRPYAMLLADVIVSVADEFEEITHKYFNDRPVRHRGILVIGTDKGLCGALNANLFRNFLMLILLRNLLLLEKEQPSFCHEHAGIYLLILVCQINHATLISNQLLNFFLRAYGDDKIDTIEVLHTGFVNTLRQEAELVRLFPLNDLDEMSQKLHQRFGIEDHEVPKDST